jgi:hypothetical protein
LVTPIVVKHLITEYGEIPMDKVRVKATLIAAAKDRTTQDDDQLFTCLMESITKATRNTVSDPRASRRSGRKLAEWLTKKPTDGKMIKEVNGKNYHWCDGDSGKNHSPKWVIH